MNFIITMNLISESCQQFCIMKMTFMLLLVLAIATTGYCSKRETVNFDFAWKFKLGEGIIPKCPEKEFPKDLSDVHCSDLERIMIVTTADDCRGMCCNDPMCAVWQFSNTNVCFIGQGNNCTTKAKNWIGGKRTVPGKAPKPPALHGSIARDYDDSDWEIVDVPHDSVINGEYSESASNRQAFLPKNWTYYRKHFSLPTEWKGMSIWVYFEGVFRATSVYLNGKMLKYHDSGYTSFGVRIDNASTIYYGDGKKNDNVLAIICSAIEGSGWWYEGGGIYRHVYLIGTSHLHFAIDGVYGASFPEGSISSHDTNDRSKGLYADSAMIKVTAEVINEADLMDKVYLYTFLYDESGNEVGSIDTPYNTIGGMDTIKISTSFNITHAELWSPGRPYMYTLSCTTFDGSYTDDINITIGIRTTHWDPNNGFYLNRKHFTWRGFNNHNDFTGVGMAVPDRINLFRAQQMRAVGANSWRMSHNPPTPVLLDILDSVGIIVWDENREYGDNDVWVQNQRDMVRRDRNHPSVMVWSFCNEAGCNYGDSDEAIATMFANVSKEEDPYRPITANQNGDIGGGLSNVIDLQGFSHRHDDVFVSYHETYPDKPLIGSECCSCVTQRGEDFPDELSLGNFNADCNSEQTEYQLNLPYVAGCMVWTLFDYYGEPHPFEWPHISSSFGSIDLAGFAKASAYWYRSWWLYNAMKNHSTGGYDVPINVPRLVNPDATDTEDNGKDGYLVHIVEHWEKNDKASTRTVHVYTNAPMAELFVNGKSQGIQKIVWQGWAQWDNVAYSPGNLTATALDDQHSVVATHTIMTTTGDPSSIKVYLDVPSEDTGTGSALVLNGEDAGMVSAAILDSNGRVCHGSSLNVSFSIVSGPGRIIGVGNGDPSCHEPNQASWRSAYHGLARVIVQVTEDHTSQYRDRMIQIDRNGGIRTRVFDSRSSTPALDGIVVEATAPGVGSSTVTIPVTTDANNHNVLAVAKKSFK